MFLPFAVAEFVIGRTFKEENFFFLSARKIHEILLSHFFMEGFNLRKHDAERYIP
jgi:hypothetical protein